MDKLNILIDTLPETVMIDGMEFSIRTDFRYCILFELLIQDSEVTDKEKVVEALKLFFEEMPDNTEAAVDSILWFYSCGNVDNVSRGNGKSHEPPDEHKTNQKRLYDFNVDAELIYAAFLDQYGIDLADAELHWWKFRALFNGLKSDNEFCKIVGYRSVDLSQIKNKSERKRLAILKNRYALPCILSEEEKVAMAGNAFAGGSR